MSSFTVSFDSVDWTLLRSVYGWSACQYQAWARGKLFVGTKTDQTVILYTDRVIEFWVDQKPYFGGDLYAFRNARMLPDSLLSILIVIGATRYRWL